MIFIAAKHRVRPENAERWAEVVEEFTRAVRSEPGCLWFEWSRSLDDPNEFVLLEGFRDEKAGAAHVESEHFRRAMEALPTMLTEAPRIINATVPQDDWSVLKEMTIPEGP